MKENQGAGPLRLRSRGAPPRRPAANRDQQGGLPASTILCGPALENMAGARFIKRCHYHERMRGVVVSAQRGSQSPCALLAPWGPSHPHPPPAAWPHAGCLLASRELWFQLRRAWWALFVPWLACGSPCPRARCVRAVVFV